MQWGATSIPVPSDDDLGQRMLATQSAITTLGNRGHWFAKVVE
jgi:hypothetical protein